MSFKIKKLVYFHKRFASFDFQKLICFHRWPAHFDIQRLTYIHGRLAPFQIPKRISANVNASLKLIDFHGWLTILKFQKEFQQTSMFAWNWSIFMGFLPILKLKYFHIFTDDLLFFKFQNIFSGSLHAFLKLVNFHGWPIHFKIKKLTYFHEQPVLFNFQK